MKIWCVYTRDHDEDGEETQLWIGAYLTKEKAEAKVTSLQETWRQIYRKWPERGEQIAASFYAEQYEVT